MGAGPSAGRLDHLGIIDRTLRLLRGEQTDFKFLPRLARKKLEQIHDFKQSAPDHQTPEGKPPFPNLGKNHAAIPWTHQVFGSSATG